MQTTLNLISSLVHQEGTEATHPHNDILRLSQLELAAGKDDKSVSQLRWPFNQPTPPHFDTQHHARLWRTAVGVKGERRWW